MAEQHDEITADEVRDIRKGLGLSQTEAGELLGGGPRAFTKYEAGTVKPAAAVVRLLRLLEAHPEMIASLKGDRSRPMSIRPEPRPFQVTGEHIAAMTEHTFHLLLRRLLVAETLANNLPADGIHVADNITAPDGGEDGRIAWEGGPDRTRFLPWRLTQFQLKSGKIPPSKAGNEVLAKGGEVKDMVRRTLEAGGHYVMLCAHHYSKKEIETREDRIRSVLRASGVRIEDAQVQFRDAGQIADWASNHPSVATWAIELTQPGTVGPFRSWTHWAGRGEYELSPWVEDERLKALRTFLLERVNEPRGTVRVLGLSAIGKSRLVLQALGPTDNEERDLSQIVLYADESEAEPGAIHRVVQTWADMGARAIVVVDRCEPEMHESLANVTARGGSRLSLITIDNEVPSGVPDRASFVVDHASLAVTAEVIASQARGMDEDTRQRLARFADGFPGLAVRVGRAWTDDRPVVQATDDHFVDAFIRGREPLEAELVLRTARLLSAFGLVWHDDPSLGHFHGIAEIDGSMTASELRIGTQKLIRQGVAQRRGRFVRIQPRPVAARLAERQWKHWSPAEWDEVLFHLEQKDLRILAARQLAWLGETDISREVVTYVCRHGGPVRGLEGIEGGVHAEVLSRLAEIEPFAVVNQLERSLDAAANLSHISDCARRHVVWALERISFDQETFEEGAELLLRLAVAENEPDLVNNATGQFCALFPLLLGATEADGKTRLAFLNDTVETDDRDKLVVVVQALIKATETRHFIRFGGSERRGVRPDRVSWRPNTNQDAREYIGECLDLLAALGARKDEIGAVARDGLGGHFRSLAAHGFIEDIERVVERVGEGGIPWRSGIEGLSQFIQYDSTKVLPDTVERVKRLLDTVKPEDLEDRARYLITDMPWHFPAEEKLDMETRRRRQEEAIRNLARDFVQHPDALRDMLPKLCRGPQRMAALFGECLAEMSPDPTEWLGEIKRATVEIPCDERNFDLLAGHARGMVDRYPEVVERLKRTVSESPELAPGFPLVCLELHIASDDVEMAADALATGRLPPGQLVHWTIGGQLAKLPTEVVVPLFDAMLDHSIEGFEVGLELIGMYVFGDEDRLEELRPQVCRAAVNFVRWEGETDDPLAGSHFEEIMQWVLSKGRKDPDARRVALALSKALAQASEVSSDRLLATLVPTLLAEFPEISWPLIGNAIVSDELQAWRLHFVLSDRGLGVDADARGRPILNLPEETLFAWCTANPDVAPEFVARVLPILARADSHARESILHPIMAKFLNEFGDAPGVVEAVEGNLNSFGWVGSVVPYFEAYVEPLKGLRTHRRKRVRRWASNALRRVERQIENARDEDAEQAAMVDL